MVVAQPLQQGLGGEVSHSLLNRMFSLLPAAILTTTDLLLLQLRSVGPVVPPSPLSCWSSSQPGCLHTSLTSLSSTSTPHFAKLQSRGCCSSLVGFDLVEGKSSSKVYKVSCKITSRNATQRKLRSSAPSLSRFKQRNLSALPRSWSLIYFF